MPSIALRGRLSAPLRISLVYALVGAAWIWLTDERLFAAGLPDEAWLLSVGKGMFFVLASSLLIFVLVGREVRRRQRSAAQLEAVLGAAPLGIAATDAAGAVIQWNRAAERLVDRPAADVIGRPADAIGLPAAASPAERAADLDLARSDGGAVPVRAFMAELADPSPGRVFLLQDMRPRLRAEAVQRQVQKLDAVTRLAGNMAQEFNNVLTVMLGHAALLTERLDDDDPRREHADELRRAGERAASLTRQLLVISGQDVAQPVALDLTRLIADMRPVAERILGSDVRLELQLEDRPWPIVSDPGQLQQAVVNLLVNARDAMPDGGVLCIETRNAYGDGAADGVPEGEYVLLRIRDTGSGMDRATLDRLFEPFFTTKRQATGLGLVTVHTTVQKFGALIRVDSTPQRGTSFDIWWPRAHAAGGVGAGDRSSGPTSRAGAVLVVEDDPAVRDLAVRVLRRSGLQVLEAASAEAALVLLEGEPPPDLVVADIVLPGMSGTEFADRVRVRHPDVPVLFTSGNAAGALRDAADLRAGTAFLEKPYAPADLVDRVTRLIGQPAG